MNRHNKHIYRIWHTDTAVQQTCSRCWTSLQRCLHYTLPMNSYSIPSSLSFSSILSHMKFSTLIPHFFHLVTHWSWNVYPINIFYYHIVIIPFKHGNWYFWMMKSHTQREKQPGPKIYACSGIAAFTFFSFQPRKKAIFCSVILLYKFYIPIPSHTNSMNPHFVCKCV